MDSVILDKKIDSILRCLARIEQRLPVTEDKFMADYDAQDVVAFNITRAVQARVDIATHFLSTGNKLVQAVLSYTAMMIGLGHNVCNSQRSFAGF